MHDKIYSAIATWSMLKYYLSVFIDSDFFKMLCDWLISNLNSFVIQSYFVCHVDTEIHLLFSVSYHYV